MVHAASDPLTEAAEAGVVHWTLFPAHAVAIDWTDHRAAHRAVMRLFPDDLDGPPGQVRAANGILFRLDVIHDVLHVLVQSRIAPALVPPNARTMTVPAAAWNVTAGDQVRLRVAINPVIRNGTHRTETPVPATDAAAWIATRLEAAFGDVTLLNHTRDVYAQRHHGRKVRGGDTLVVDTLDAVATVTDPTVVDRIRLDGLGRRKAYGAGLLTTQRLS